MEFPGGYDLLMENNRKATSYTVITQNISQILFHRCWSKSIFSSGITHKQHFTLTVPPAHVFLLLQRYVKTPLCDDIRDKYDLSSLRCRT